MLSPVADEDLLGLLAVVDHLMERHKALDQALDAVAAVSSMIGKLFKTDFKAAGDVPKRASQKIEVEILVLGREVVNDDRISPERSIYG